MELFVKVIINYAPAVIYSETYNVHLGGLERRYGFDLHKHRKIWEQLRLRGPAPLELLEPAPLSKAELQLVHDPGYLMRLRNPDDLAEALEFPLLRRLPAALLEETLWRAILHIGGGTLRACREALTRGLAINLGGGYHHAQAAQGGGFCAIADVAIGIRALLAEGRIRRAAIVDCDLHQGNGNAEIFAQDARVFTFSIHQEDNYPFAKARSDMDIGLSSKARIDDAAYLKTLGDALPDVLTAARPDLVVYLAGTDIYVEDPLSGFRISQQGIVARDLMVLREVAVRRGIPLALVLAGGYSPQSWELHVAALEALLRAGSEAFGDPRSMPAPVGTEP